MAEIGQVKFGDATIEYEVQRSERRTKTVQITMDGSRVLVAAPAGAPDSKVEEIVRRRAPMILRQMSEPIPQASRNRLVSGETLPYLGRSVRPIVDLSDIPSPEVKFDHWPFRVTVPLTTAANEPYEHSRREVVKWYR